ncbi:MAG: DUF1273 family protein [Clostridiales bacterium]|nr:DUF1273 family protein [Clostridiales bacterium]
MDYGCSFSGHRLVGTDLDLNLLCRVIENLINFRGVTNFFCGMAKGFDLIAGECVIKLKEKYPNIKLFACVPHQGQADYYCAEDKRRYAEILHSCNEIFTLSTHYYNGCMLYRDRYMVERTQFLVCFLREKKGGTFYTYNYAKKKGLQIIEV